MRTSLINESVTYTASKRKEGSVNAPTPTAPSPTAGVNMTLVWSGVVFVVFVFGGLATPWDVISELIANRGPSEAQASVVAFVAGYTLPLTAATSVSCTPRCRARSTTSSRP